MSIESIDMQRFGQQLKTFRQKRQLTQLALAQRSGVPQSLISDLEAGKREGVTLDMAPAASQQTIQKYGRPEYDQLIASVPNETSLPADQQVAAFAKWDQLIGAAKAK